jgi:hypothetical protein
MLASLLVIFGMLCYHNTGATQAGYFRFSLDFLPVWFAVLAPGVLEPRRSWFALCCTAWSAWYFSLIVP